MLGTWEELIHPIWISLVRVPTPATLITERFFSQVVSQTLTAVQRRRVEEPGKVLLACADEEHHTLPIETLAAALAETDVGSSVLGARVPPQALTAATRRLRPSVDETYAAVFIDAIS